MLLQILAPLVVALAFAFWGAMYVAQLGFGWCRYSTPDLKVFRLPDEHVVAWVSQRWLVVNLREHCVVRVSSPMLLEIGPLALIRLDRLRGVLLGDGVKGNEDEGWIFEADGVDVTLAERASLERHRIPF